MCGYLIALVSECKKCGTDGSGQKSCCGVGGDWEGKCGQADDASKENTWGEGLDICKGPMCVYMNECACAIVPLQLTFDSVAIENNITGL